MCMRRHDYERGGIIIIIIIIRRNLNALVRPDARPGQGLLERVAQRNRLCAARRQVALAGQGGTRRRLMHQPCCLRSLQTLARLQARRQPRHDIRATIEITERRADPLAVSAEHSGRWRQSRRLRARHGSAAAARPLSWPNVGPHGRKARDQTNFGLIPARTHDSEDHGKASQAKCTSSTPDEQCATMPPSGVRPVTTCTQHGTP